MGRCPQDNLRARTVRKARAALRRRHHLSGASVSGPASGPTAGSSSGRPQADGAESLVAHPTPLVGVVMGSASDYETLAPACETLAELGIPYEARVVSAHRTPDWLFEYAETAEPRGLQVIIAGAGGAAHLPGMLAAKTLIPVLGVPVNATALNGLDALMSIVQMPAGVPVGTLAIGKPGAANAALFAAQILALRDSRLLAKLSARRASRAAEALAKPLPAPGAISPT